MNLYEIYNQFQQDFLRFARSLTYQQQSAEDLVQQSYLKALDALELFEQMHPQQIKGWFFTTIKRLYIDEWRQIKLRRNILEKMAMEMSEYQCYEGTWLESLAVRHVLSQLSQSERTLILYRYEVGLNSGEIGEKLDIPASTVRNQLAIAKRRFNELLDASVDDLEKGEII